MDSARFFSKILGSITFLYVLAILNNCQQFVYGQTGVCKTVPLQPNKIRIFLGLTPKDDPKKYESFESCWHFQIPPFPSNGYVQLTGRGNSFCRVHITVVVDGEKVKTTTSPEELEVMKFSGKKVRVFVEVFGCTCRSDIVCKLTLGYNIHRTVKCEDKVIEIQKDTKYAISNADMEIGNKKCKFVFKCPESYNLVVSAVKVQDDRTFKGSLISHFQRSEKGESTDVEVTKSDDLTFDLGSSAILSVEMRNVVMVDSNADLIEVEITLQGQTKLDCRFVNTTCHWSGNLSISENSPAVELVATENQNAEMEGPEIETQGEGICLNVAYSTIKNVFDVFYVIWETNNASKVLYKEFGKEVTDLKAKVDLPKCDSGKIRILLNKVAGKTEAKARLKAIRTQTGSCFPETTNDLNCNFNGTLCKWVGRPKGIVRYKSGKKVWFNERSTAITSPNVPKGEYCLVLNVAGRGRLSVLMQQGANTNFMTSYLIKNSTSVKKLKIGKDDIDDKFKIILKFSGLRATDETPDLYILRTVLSPVTNCPNILSPQSVWKFSRSKTKDTFMELSHKLGFRSTNKIVSLFTFQSVPIWFCFLYQFTAPTSLNDVCIEVGTEEKNKEQLLWKRCGGNGTFQKQCIEIREGISASVFVKTSNHPEKTITPDKLINPDQVANFSVLVSSPWIQTHWNCDFSNMCGWYQSTFNFVLFYGQFSFRAIKYPETQNESNVDFLYSPMISPTSSKACVSFKIGAKLLTILNVKVVNSLGEDSILLRTFFPKYGEQINQTIFVTSQQYRLAIGIGHYSFQMGPDLSGSNTIEHLKVKDGPCSESETKSVICDFDSGKCGWIENRWSRVKNITSFYKGTGSDLLPPVDCTYQESGKYGKLYSVTDTGVSETYRLTSPQLSGTDIGRDICISFCYYMHGKKDDETSLNLVFDSEDKRTVWSKQGDQDMSWYKVQFPLVTSEEFRLSFRVSSAKNPDQYGIAIDSVAVQTGSCESFDETVDQPF